MQILNVPHVVITMQVDFNIKFSLFYKKIGHRYISMRRLSRMTIVNSQGSGTASINVLIRLGSAS